MSYIPEKAGAPEKATDKAVARVVDPAIPSNPYSGISREISESDLEAPAVKRILLGEVDKLQSQINDLESYKSEFHKADKKSAILEEKISSMNSGEILYSICLTVGSILIGLSTAVWDTGYGWIPIGLGVILIVSGLTSKAIKR